MRTDFNMRDERGVAPGLTGLTDQVNRYHQQQRTDAALSERLRSNSVMETLNQDKFAHQVGLDDQEAMMAQLKREKMGEFANILSSGTDSDVTGWIAENPLIAKEIGARGQGDFRSEESRKSMLATMYQVLSNPSQENAEAQFASRDKVLDQQGVPMEERQESAELRMLFGTDPEEAIRRTRNYLAANDADNFKKYRSGSGEDVGASGGYVAQEAFEKATKQAWKDAHNGEEIPASKLAEELIGWKRAQAVERYGVVSAEQQARVDKAQALAYNAQIGKDLGIIKNARDVVKARGDIPADEKKAAAKTRMSGNIADVADMLFRLDEMNAIPNVDKSWIDNLISYGKSAEWTQPLQTATGGEGAAVREALNTRIPLMLNDIRQSSEMGARGIDTERELDFYKSAIGSTRGNLQSNMAALVALDRQYGDGKIAKALEGKYDRDAVDKLIAEGRKIYDGKGTGDWASDKWKPDAESQAWIDQNKLPSVNSQAAFDALPSGALYMEMGPDGNLHRATKP